MPLLENTEAAQPKFESSNKYIDDWLSKNLYNPKKSDNFTVTVKME